MATLIDQELQTATRKKTCVLSTCGARGAARCQAEAARCQAATASAAMATTRQPFEKLKNDSHATSCTEYHLKLAECRALTFELAALRVVSPTVTCWSK